MSESFMVGSLLALVGGFLDAYTYITRGSVFATAQTGNIVLLGINVSNGYFAKAISYLVPIAAFSIGVIVAEIIKNRYPEKKNIHWRQIIIGIECVALIVVALIPEEFNTVANVIVSFVCAMQVESFRKFNGNPYATTMCTGNLRSATEHLYYYRKNHDSKLLHKSLQYFMIIGFFILGACIGSLLSKVFYLKALLFNLIALIIVIILMTQNEKR